MDNKEIIEGFVRKIAGLLNIAVPKVKYNTRYFQTNTMLAQAYIGIYAEPIIYLRQADSVTFDTFFSIAHEMRHFWQVKNDYELYMRHYKNRSKVDLETYNNQLAEVDANAFAMIVMEELFDITPLFNRMSEKTKALIEKRADEIII